MKKPKGVTGGAIWIGAALLAISPLLVVTLRGDEPKGPACMAPGNRTVQLRPGLTCWVEDKPDGSLELLARDTAEDDAGWDCQTMGNGQCGTCRSVVVPGVDHKYGPYGIGDQVTTTCR